MNKVISTFLFFVLFIATGLYADAPAQNVSPARHRNLAVAQALVDKAYERVIDAQKANEFDMGGHAEKVRSLLEQTNQELKLSAVQANEHNTGSKIEENASTGMPVTNVSETKHPNLATAQELIDRAYRRVFEAQKSNEFDMQGHAAKAKSLLEEASKEIKLAAAEANEKDHKK